MGFLDLFKNGEEKLNELRQEVGEKLSYSIRRNADKMEKDIKMIRGSMGSRYFVTLYEDKIIIQDKEENKKMIGSVENKEFIAGHIKETYNFGENLTQKEEIQFLKTLKDKVLSNESFLEDFKEVRDKFEDLKSEGLAQVEHFYTQLHKAKEMQQKIKNRELENCVLIQMGLYNGGPTSNFKIIDSPELHHAESELSKGMRTHKDVQYYVFKEKDIPEAKEAFRKIEKLDEELQKNPDKTSQSLMDANKNKLYKLEEKALGLQANVEKSRDFTV